MAPDTAAPWECGRCGEMFADHEEAQGHADTCDRPTMRVAAPCSCWPSGGPPCPAHGEIRRNPHHEHGHYYGNDMWDASCCICDDNPCPAVTVDNMRCHRWYDLERERRLAAMPATDEPPF